jgi:hypothetical protein
MPDSCPGRCRHKLCESLRGFEGRMFQRSSAKVQASRTALSMLHSPMACDPVTWDAGRGVGLGAIEELRRRGVSIYSNCSSSAGGACLPPSEISSGKVSRMRRAWLSQRCCTCHSAESLFSRVSRDCTKFESLWISGWHRKRRARFGCNRKQCSVRFTVRRPHKLTQ